MYFRHAKAGVGGGWGGGGDSLWLRPCDLFYQDL